VLQKLPNADVEVVDLAARRSDPWGADQDWALSRPVTGTMELGHRTNDVMSLSLAAVLKHRFAKLRHTMPLSR
jgi:hypothetical protein